MGRGQDRPHRTIDRRADGVPVVGLDFFFIGDDMSDGTVPAVAMRDNRSKFLCGHMIPGKGMDMEWTAQRVSTDIDNLGYRRISLRSDQEPAIIALLEKVKRLCSTEVVLETAPKGDKNANGIAERAVQAVEGQLRTLKLELEGRV